MREKTGSPEQGGCKENERIPLKDRKIKKRLLLILILAIFNKIMEELNE